MTRDLLERDAREVQPRLTLRCLVAIFLAIGFACLSPRSGKAASPAVGTAFGAAESQSKWVFSTPERNGTISVVPGTVRERPTGFDCDGIGQRMAIHRFDFGHTLITGPIAVVRLKPTLVGTVELRV